jgi:hypothetical protein
MSDHAGTRVLIDGGSSAGYPDGLYRFDRSAEYIDRLEDIGEPELAFFQERGYLAVRQAFDATEMRDALAGLLAVIAGAGADRFPGLDLQFEARVRERIDTIPPDQRQDHVRKLMRFVRHDPRLAAMAQQPSLTAVVRQIVGEADLVMFQDMALLKPPGGGREKPWHQDKAFFSIRTTSPVVGVWIALDPATPENGCMHVIPGSHREGPVVHFKRRDWQICDDAVEVARDVMVPLEPGGCLFFDGLMHHGTPANRTTLRRRALQFHYTSASAPWGTEEDRLAIFGSEGKDVTC